MSESLIKGALSANLTGQVFLLCKEFAVCTPVLMHRYETDIREVLEKMAASGASSDALYTQLQIELKKLRGQLSGEGFDTEPAIATGVDALLEVDDLASSEHHMDGDVDDFLRHLDAELGEADRESEAQSEIEPEDESVAEPVSPEAEEQEAAERKSSGYKPKHTDMQEKLNIQRKPLKELLSGECVNQGLLNSKRAKHWIHNMSGRVKEEVEAEIVAELAQNLHDKVKNYIRKNKGDNPWSTPTLQNDLRTDVTSVKTVKGILILSAQINAEVDRHEAGKNPGIFKRLFRSNKL